MNNQKLWFGFLDAGIKSSPVVRDLTVEQGSSDNIYLYNMKAEKILLYKASIVESKLRELKPAEEKEFMSDLESGFKKASKEFKIPTAATLYSSNSKIAAKKAKVTKSDDENLPDMDSDDIDLDIDTELMDGDSEMVEEDETEVADDDM